MKYMGSKNRIANKILPIILGSRMEGQYYVEPFVGGANMIDKVEGQRIGGELNEYVATMWIKIESGWKPPYIEKPLYIDIRDNKSKYPKELVGWAGVACSYSGKWFGGYAGLTHTAKGERDYMLEAIYNLEKQLPHIKGVQFEQASYDELDFPRGSLIYCDPPYKGTTGYKDSFNHDDFWEWVRLVSRENTVYVSEYTAPSDFECVWEQAVKSSLSANGVSGGNKVSVERLFRRLN